MSENPSVAPRTLVWGWRQIGAIVTAPAASTPVVALGLATALLPWLMPLSVTSLVGVLLTVRLGGFLVPDGVVPLVATTLVVPLPALALVIALLKAPEGIGNLGGSTLLRKAGLELSKGRLKGADYLIGNGLLQMLDVQSADGGGREGRGGGLGESGGRSLGRGWDPRCSLGAGGARYRSGSSSCAQVASLGRLRVPWGNGRVGGLRAKNSSLARKLTPR